MRYALAIALALDLVLVVIACGVTSSVEGRVDTTGTDDDPLDVDEGPPCIVGENNHQSPSGNQCWCDTGFTWCETTGLECCPE